MVATSTGAAATPRRLATYPEPLAKGGYVLVVAGLHRSQVAWQSDEFRTTEPTGVALGFVLPNWGSAASGTHRLSVPVFQSWAVPHGRPRTGSPTRPAVVALRLPRTAAPKGRPLFHGRASPRLALSGTWAGQAWPDPRERVQVLCLDGGLGTRRVRADGPEAAYAGADHPEAETGAVGGIPRERMGDSPETPSRRLGAGTGRRGCSRPTGPRQQQGEPPRASPRGEGPGVALYRRRTSDRHCFTDSRGPWILAPRLGRVPDPDHGGLPP